MNNKYFLYLDNTGDLGLYSDPSLEVKYRYWHSNSANRGKGPYKSSLEGSGDFVIKDMS